MTSQPGWTPPRRVVVVNGSGECSGAEAVLLDVVDLARADGVDLTVASPTGPLVDRLPAGVRHVPLPAFGVGAGPGAIARVRGVAGLTVRTGQAARALRPEVSVPGTHTLVNSLLALPAVRLARPVAPPTWLVHDTVNLGAQRAFVRMALAGRGGLGLAVAVSEATAAPLRALGCRVEVRVNGVPWPVDPVPLELGDPPVVGAAALLTAWKGHRVLLDALAEVPHVRCEIAGGHLAADVPYVEELRRRAAAPDLSGRVTFLGHVDVAAALQGWDVAVSSSTSPEAGPLAVLEAMGAGVPVVATDHGGSADYLAGGCGILVPPGDPSALAAGILEALDPATRARLSVASRARVAERHDRSATLPALYRAVMTPA